MKKYLIQYHDGDKPASKELAQKQRQDWMAWVEELGELVINPGTPLLASFLINKKDGLFEESNESFTHGTAIIQAKDQAHITKLVAQDPFLNTNGFIRVSEMMEMPGS